MSFKPAAAQFGPTLPAMLLLSPLGWLYYDPWLLLPAALVWAWGRTRPRPRVVTLGLVLLATMAAAPRTFTLSYFVNAPYTWLLDWGFYTYLLLGLFGMAVVLSRSARLEQPATGHRFAKLRERSDAHHGHPTGTTTAHAHHRTPP